MVLPELGRRLRRRGSIADFRLPLDRRIKKLSRGQLSAVGVIVGLASRAPLTFFDEPYLGLDAVARQMFYDRLLERLRRAPAHRRALDPPDRRGQQPARARARDRRGPHHHRPGRRRPARTATTVVGHRAAVDAFVARPRGAAPRRHRRARLGDRRRASTRRTAPRPPPPGSSSRPVSLQQLIVRTTPTPPRRNSSSQRMTAITAHAARHRAARVGRILNVVRLHLANPWTTIILPWMILGVIFVAQPRDLVLDLRGRDARRTRANVARGCSTAARRRYIFVYMMVVAMQAINRHVPVRARLRRDPPRLLARHRADLRAALGDVRVGSHDPVGRSSSATDGWGLGGRMFTPIYFGDDAGRQRLFIFFARCCSSSSSGRRSRPSGCAGRRTGIIVFFTALAVLVLGGDRRSHPHRLRWVRVRGRPSPRPARSGSRRGCCSRRDRRASSATSSCDGRRRRGAASSWNAVS